MTVLPHHTLTVWEPDADGASASGCVVVNVCWMVNRLRYMRLLHQKLRVGGMQSL